MNDLFGHDSGNLPIDLSYVEGVKWSKIDYPSGFQVDLPGGQLVLIQSFFDKKISDRAVEYFSENDSHNPLTTDWAHINRKELEEIHFSNIQWSQEKIKIYGKEHFIPRLTAWYGDSGKRYTYSGISQTSHPWNKGLLYLKNKIEKATQTSFNSLLLNWYRDGKDHISWHADDEKELGDNPDIASVSFGASRRFLLRRKDDHKVKIEIPVDHGTLLLMRGDLQKFWEHSVPKQASSKSSRFNLTFRNVY